MDGNATKYLEAIAGSLIDQHLIIGLTQRSRFIILYLFCFLEEFPPASSHIKGTSVMSHKRHKEAHDAFVHMCINNQCCTHTHTHTGLQLVPTVLCHSAVVH